MRGLMCKSANRRQNGRTVGGGWIGMIVRDHAISMFTERAYLQTAAAFEPIAPRVHARVGI